MNSLDFQLIDSGDVCECVEKRGGFPNPSILDGKNQKPIFILRPVAEHNQTFTGFSIASTRRKQCKWLSKDDWSFLMTLETRSSSLANPTAGLTWDDFSSSIKNTCYCPWVGAHLSYVLGCPPSPQ